MLWKFRNSKKILHQNINNLEKIKDPKYQWRNFYNNKLKLEYKKLFKLFDELIFLKTSSFDNVFKWRLKQEKTNQSKNKKSTQRNSLTDFRPELHDRGLSLSWAFCRGAEFWCGISSFCRGRLHFVMESSKSVVEPWILSCCPENSMTEVFFCRGVHFAAQAQMNRASWRSWSSNPSAVHQNQLS